MMTKHVLGVVVIYLFTHLLPSLAMEDSEVAAIANKDAGSSLYNMPWSQSTPDSEQLNTLVRNALGFRPYEYSRISNRLLLDVNQDGIREMVVTVDERCSSDPVLIVVFFKDGADIKAQSFRTERANLKWDLTDLNGDGLYEVIRRETFVSSTSHAEVALWPEIYQWQESQYVIASASFPDYYRKSADQLQEEIDRLEEIDPSELAREQSRDAQECERWKGYRIADHIALRDKAKRLLGDKRAGFEQAVRWWASGDDNLKRNAITVFEDIGDEESIQRLEQAAEDEDEIVSRRAKQALRRLQNSGE